MSLCTETRGKLFLTYDSGMTQEESDKIIKDVVHIHKNAERQGFVVSMDSYGPARDERVRHAIVRNFNEVRIAPACDERVRHAIAKNFDEVRRAETFPKNWIRIRLRDLLRYVYTKRGHATY